MKGYHLNILAALLIGSVAAQAQNNRSADGIYHKADDFKNQKVAEQLGTGDKLQTNSFFGGSQVKVVRDGKRNTLAKNDLFGCRENGKDYRFYKNGEYQIADTAGFYLYKRNEFAAGRKGQVPQPVYYFSKSAISPLLKLTIGNLNKEYQEETNFRYALMDYFKTDAQLANYDAQLKTYQLKYIYAQHSKSAMAK